MDDGFELRTERLRLRPLEMSDLDDLASILGEPEHMRYYPAPFTREQSRAWIETQRQRYETDGFGLWAIDDVATGEFLGDCGLVRQVVEGQPDVEVGWHVKPSRGGQGIATEAGRACIDYGFKTLGLDRIISIIRPINIPSARVAQKLGMSVEREATFKDIHHHIYLITP